MTNGCGPRPADDTWARKYQACPIDDDSNDDWRPMGRQMSKRWPKNKQQLSANDVRMHKQANNRCAVCAWLVLAPRAASTPLEHYSPRHSMCAMISQGELRVLVARDLPGATLLTATRANLRVTRSDTSRRTWRPYPLANERAPGVHSGIAATALQGATPSRRPRLIVHACAAAYGLFQAELSRYYITNLRSECIGYGPPQRTMTPTIKYYSHL
ncbi:hypothetical protein BD779DRAFT_1473610 [Infundibulicybe gibba]|nr:hypothetical protein BD779DRAFT_1473610 [Infundibulicybe gibba]